VKSHETAIQVTMGAVPRTPKMNPNFRRSMMMSKAKPPLVVPDSLPEGRGAAGHPVPPPAHAATAVAASTIPHP
jgi:hypothetical protein